MAACARVLLSPAGASAEAQHAPTELQCGSGSSLQNKCITAEQRATGSGTGSEPPPFLQGGSLASSSQSSTQPFTRVLSAPHLSPLLQQCSGNVFSRESAYGALCSGGSVCSAFNEGSVINIFGGREEILLPCELHLEILRVIHYFQADASLSLNLMLQPVSGVPRLSSQPCAEAEALTYLSKLPHYGRRFPCRQLVRSPTPAAQIVLSSKGWKKSSALCQAVFFQLTYVLSLLPLQAPSLQRHYSWR